MKQHSDSSREGNCERCAKIVRPKDKKICMRCYICLLHKLASKVNR